MALCAVAMLLAVSVGNLGATTKDDIGFNRLADELGEKLPSGASVPVALVESNTSQTQLAFLPDLNNSQFKNPDKDFNIVSASGVKSPHADIVAIRFFGNTSSLTPGVTSVDLYFADDWLESDYLHSNTQQLPEITDARVFNHSWVIQTSSEKLARIDFTTEEYDVLHVVGVNNTNNGGPFAGLASAYNSISVGRSDGRHETGSVHTTGPASLSHLYSSGITRVKPDLVVPESFTSYSTAFVSSAAALLIDTGHTRPELSGGSFMAPGNPDYVIQHAETSEVIKSALMAGANRNVWTDYGSEEFATNNGLDMRFGAGQLDIYKSYHIIAGGEQDSHEAGNESSLNRFGFDYIAGMDLGETATYTFEVGPIAESLAISAAWNVDVEIAGNSVTAELAGFGLLLFRESEDGDRETIDFSIAENENTANIWLPELTPNSLYELQLLRLDGPASGGGPWDVGLSWRRELLGLLPGDVNGDGNVGLADFNVFKQGFGFPGTWENGDFDGNGLVDLADFLILKRSFGSRIPPNEIASGSDSSAVPEATSFSLVCSALITFLVLRHTRGTSYRSILITVTSRKYPQTMVPT